MVLKWGELLILKMALRLGCAKLRNNVHAMGSSSWAAFHGYIREELYPSQVFQIMKVPGMPDSVVQPTCQTRWFGEIALINFHSVETPAPVLVCNGNLSQNPYKLVWPLLPRSHRTWSPGIIGTVNRENFDCCLYHLNQKVKTSGHRCYMAIGQKNQQFVFWVETLLRARPWLWINRLAFKLKRLHCSTWQLSWCRGLYGRKFMYTAPDKPRFDRRRWFVKTSQRDSSLFCCLIGWSLLWTGMSSSSIAAVCWTLFRAAQMNWVVALLQLFQSFGNPSRRCLYCTNVMFDQ